MTEHIDEIEKRVDKAFGDWLVERRMYLGIGAAAVALVSGVNRLRIRHLERGSTTRGATVQECRSLAKALCCDEEEVIGRAAGTWNGSGRMPA